MSATSWKMWCSYFGKGGLKQFQIIRSNNVCELCFEAFQEPLLFLSLHTFSRFVNLYIYCGSHPKTGCRSSLNGQLFTTTVNFVSFLMQPMIKNSYYLLSSMCSCCLLITDDNNLSFNNFFFWWIRRFCPSLFRSYGFRNGGKTWHLSCATANTFGTKVVYASRFWFNSRKNAVSEHSVDDINRMTKWCFPFCVCVCFYSFRNLTR